MGAFQSKDIVKPKVKVEIHVPMVPEPTQAAIMVQISDWLEKQGQIYAFNKNPRTYHNDSWIKPPLIYKAEIGLSTSDELEGLLNLAESLHTRQTVVVSRRSDQPIIAFLTLSPDYKSEDIDQTQVDQSLKLNTFEFGTMPEFGKFLGSMHQLSVPDKKDTFHLHYNIELNQLLLELSSERKDETIQMEIADWVFFDVLSIHMSADETQLFIHLKQRPLLRRGKAGEKAVRFIDKNYRDVIGESDIIKLVFTKQRREFIKLLKQLKKKGWQFRFHPVESSKQQVEFEVSSLPQTDSKLEYLSQVLQSRSLKMKTKLSLFPLFTQWLGNSDISLSDKVYVVKKLLGVCDTHSDWYFINLNDVAEDMSQTSIRRSPQDNLVKYGILTPTRLLLEADIKLPKQQEKSCRILRENDTGCYLRLSIRDEDLSQFIRPNDELIHNAVAVDRLYNGLEIGGELYRFLAASMSQLREHGCYLFHVGKKGQMRQSTDDLRKQIGDFNGIRCVGKYVKRMGQAFSQTTQGPFIKPDQIKREQDIKKKATLKSGQSIEYCFSDGIGKIEPAFLDEVLIKARKRSGASAIQIRLGGAKGVLVRDPSMKEQGIILRESMVKFESKHMTLDIQMVSMPKCLYLNHQIVTLLSGLGVKDKCFFELQQSAVDNLLWSLLDKNKAQLQLQQNFSWILPTKHLDKVPCAVTTVPFFKQLLMDHAREQIRIIMTKARIPIPDDEGRNMLGVLDETGHLEYGQVFIQYSKKIYGNADNYSILTGDVIVSKMPALHPGDVRKLQAVDVPALHHLHDVIVFPKKGKRPHPNEMAGSDLDGDEYWVCWRPDIIFKQDNYEAMDYAGYPEKVHTGPIKEKDLIDHQIFIIQNDVTSFVARAHLAQADLQDKGIFSRECMVLAELHSMAVDAPKTGQAVQVPVEFEPTKWPDFLEKSDHKASKRSSKCLGKLYRQYKTLHRDMFQNSSRGEDPLLFDDQIINKEDEQLANSVREYFIYELNMLLNRYGLGSEIQLILCNPTGGRKKNIPKNEIAFIKNEMKEDLKILKNRVREKLQNGKKDRSILHKRALACFKVMRSNPVKGKIFPWLVIDWLAEKTNDTTKTNDPILQNIGKRLLNYIINAFQKKKLTNASVNSALNGMTDKLLNICIKNKWLLGSYLAFSTIPLPRESERSINTFFESYARKENLPEYQPDKARSIFERFKGFFTPKKDLRRELQESVEVSVFECCLSNFEELQKIGELTTSLLLQSLHSKDDGVPLNYHDGVLSKAVVHLLLTNDPTYLLYAQVEKIEEIIEEKIKLLPKAFDRLKNAFDGDNPSKALKHYLANLTGPRNVEEIKLNEPDRLLWMKASRTAVGRIKDLIYNLNGNCPTELRKVAYNGKSNIQCYNCRYYGHIAKDCQLPKRRYNSKNQSHMG